MKRHKLLLFFTFFSVVIYSGARFLGHYAIGVIFFYFIRVLFLCLLISFLFFILSEQGGRSSEKRSPYECGFEPILSARSRFSLRFFLVAVIFVVFDVELSLLVRSVYVVYFGCGALGLFRFFVFITILFIGLLYEYREGSLEWVD